MEQPEEQDQPSWVELLKKFQSRGKGGERVILSGEAQTDCRRRCCRRRGESRYSCQPESEPDQHRRVLRRDPMVDSPPELDLNLSSGIAATNVRFLQFTLQPHHQFRFPPVVGFLPAVNPKKILYFEGILRPAPPKEQGSYVNRVIPIRRPRSKAYAWAARETFPEDLPCPIWMAAWSPASDLGKIR